MLKHRIITALILIPLVILGILYLPTLFFQALTFVILLGCLSEWANLSSPKSSDSSISKKICHIGKFLLVFLPLVGLYYYLPAQWILPLYLCVWGYAFTLVIQYQPNQTNSLSNPTQSAFFGGIVLSGAFWGFAEIHQQAQGGFLLLTLFLIIWMSDTAAYFTGRLLGKRKFSAVSPNKTLEGCAGALLGAILIGLATHYLWQHFAKSQNIPAVLGHNIIWALLCVFIALVSIFGDLFESLVKRVHHVKDSGQLLPGHGGLLDRLDSLLPTLPLFALMIIWGPK